MILLSAPLIDYLTITSWDCTLSAMAHDFIGDYAETQERIDGHKVTAKDMMIRGYAGSKYYTKSSGTLFEGYKGQKRNPDSELIPHYMVMADGQLAGEFFMYAQEAIAAGAVRCRRIDIQITEREPEEWSQIDLLKRIDETGKTTGYRKSQGLTGELATVYAGSRESQRFYRVYEKETSGGERLLRFEVEIKGDLAESIASKIARESATTGNILKYELSRYPDHLARMIFENNLESFTPQRIKVVKDSNISKTERWLLRQVLPAIKRWYNDPRHDEGVARMLVEALTENVD